MSQGPTRPRKDDGKPLIRAVRCVYTLRPWLNLDEAGDADPEGIWYRVFLQAADGKCELRDGTFHIEMYQINRRLNEKSERVLVSDWHYPTTEINVIDRPDAFAKHPRHG